MEVAQFAQQVRIVLVETSHPGNIGACARAMKTMGFTQLVLVNPRFPDALTHPDAVAFASGAQDILAQAQIVAHIDQALVDVNFVAAVSARLREFSPPILTPRALADKFNTESLGQLALVFGSERYGLPNDIVMNCNALINIPSNAAYSSLNLAQAVQILAYELRTSVQAPAHDSNIGFQGALASQAQVEGMFGHLEQALLAIGFLDPDQPKKLMPRLRRLFARTSLEVEEVNILRGIAKKMIDRDVKS